MRELKFRAWTENCWIDEGMVYDWQGTIYPECMGFNPEDVPVMQFTGIKDCNGKDIYEGDIVLIQYGTEYVTDGNTSKPLKKSVEVKYTTNLFYGCCFTADGFQLGPTCEVIGNIHENPELLES